MRVVFRFIQLFYFTKCAFNLQTENDKCMFIQKRNLLRLKHGTKISTEYFFCNAKLQIAVLAEKQQEHTQNMCIKKNIFTLTDNGIDLIKYNI